METLYETAVQTIQRHQMFHPTDTVVVACSGGADSVALLELMCRLQRQGAVHRVVVAHLHHGIRAERAQGDADFVRSLAEQKGCPYEERRLDIPAIARRDKIGLEQAGRRERYRFFEYLAKQKYPDAKVATAHTQNDNVETVLFRLTRGTGIGGLCGIPAVRDYIIRPLLQCTRAQIERYLAQCEQSYRTDETNRQVIYSRNRIRHKVMPQLRAINARCDAAIARTAAQLSQVDDYMNQQAVAALEGCRTADQGQIALSCNALQQIHPTVRAYLWRLCLMQCGVEPQSLLIDRAERLLTGGGCFCLNDAMRMRCSDDLWCIEPIPTTAKRSIASQCPARLNAEQLFGDYTFVLYEDESDIKQRQNIHNLFEIFAVDRDRIEGTLQFRNRLPSDTFQTGKRVNKKVKDLFYESKISPQQRDRIPLLCDERGIVFIPSFGVASRAAVTEKTKRILYVAVKGEAKK